MSTNFDIDERPISISDADSMAVIVSAIPIVGSASGDLVRHHTRSGLSQKITPKTKRGAPSIMSTLRRLAGSMPDEDFGIDPDL